MIHVILKLLLSTSDFDKREVDVGNLVAELFIVDFIFKKIFNKRYYMFPRELRIDVRSEKL